VVKDGRHKLISDEGINRLKNVAEARDMAKNSFSPHTFEHSFQRQRSIELTVPVQCVPEPSRSTMYNYRQLICPEQVSSPNELNNSRATAMMEIQNGVTFAAVVKAVLNIDEESQINGDVHHPALLFNVDATTLFLGAHNKDKSLMAKGSKKNCICAGRWKSGCKLSKFFNFDDEGEDEGESDYEDDVTENDEVQGQKRCVKLLVTTSARGKVSSVVIILKDSCFQHVDVHLLDNTANPPIFLVSVPKVKVVVDSEGESPSNNDFDIKALYYPKYAER
jgi:hypothetical protein